MKKIIVLAAFMLLASLSVMAVHANSNDTRYVTADMLNVRSGPRHFYPRIDEIRRGIQVTVLDSRPIPGGATWHYIVWFTTARDDTSIRNTGWVNGNFLSAPQGVVAQAPAVVAVDATLGVPLVPAENRYVTAPGSLRVRNEPSMQAGVRTYIFRNERVVVDRRYGSGNNIWYHARLVSDHYSAVGWVFGRYLAPLHANTPQPPQRTAAQTATAAAVTAPTTPAPAPAPDPMAALIGTRWNVVPPHLNVRGQPSNEGGQITSIPSGSTVEVLDTHGRGHLAWFYIRHVTEAGRYITGWVFSGHLSEL